MIEGSIYQTTTRLDARRITLAHFSEIHRLHSDPLVMKTLSADGNVMSEEATREHLQRCSDHWDQHRFGLWVFRDKADGQFIGRGGLMTYQIDGEGLVGLAYAVRSDHWNQGFATEMAEASLRFGFERLGLSEIGSWTLPINLASQRVMAKLGFRYEKDINFAGLAHRFSAAFEMAVWVTQFWVIMPRTNNSVAPSLVSVSSRFVRSKLSANSFSTSGAAGAAARMRAWISAPGVPSLKKGANPCLATCWMMTTGMPWALAFSMAPTMLSSTASVFQSGNLPPGK